MKLLVGIKMPKKIIVPLSRKMRRILLLIITVVISGRIVRNTTRLKLILLLLLSWSPTIPWHILGGRLSIRN